MQINSKFDGTNLAEIDNIKLGEIKFENSKGDFIDGMKLGKAFIESLNEFLSNNQKLSIMSNETGKTIEACKKEVKETIHYCRYLHIPTLLGDEGNVKLRIPRMKKFDFTLLDPSLPIFTMFQSIFESIRNGHRVVISHNKNSPISSMTLSSDIFQKYSDTEFLLFDILQDQPINDIDELFANSNIYSWGTPDDVRETQKVVEKNQVRWKILGNGVCIVDDRSKLEIASNSLAGLSYNSISNRGLRSQIYLVNDKDFLFFKNRVVEYLKRDIKHGYGINGDINYFNCKEDADHSRESVKRLLENGFDYVEGLNEGVHLLVNQYGDEIGEMNHICGPVIAIMHYSNLSDAVNISTKFKDRMFLNIFTDSFSKVQYINEQEGANSIIFKDLEDSSSLLKSL